MTEAVGRQCQDLIVQDLGSAAAGAAWSLELLEAPAGLSKPAFDGRELSAEVPGCVHTDLMRAGLLEDPYLAMNELEARWIGECSWRYSARFDFDEATPRSRVDLVFDGIDTLATVRLNGVELGAADNMHATWRFDVRKTLRRGANVLQIDFPAPLPFCRAEVERYRREIGEFPAGGAGANPQLPQHMLRKMHCNFGWDWGPQLVTCGIWRGVRIEAWDFARIAAVRPWVTSVDDVRAMVEVSVDLESVGSDAEVHCALTDSEGRRITGATASPAGEAVSGGGDPGAQLPLREKLWHRARATLDVDRPQLWWPAGYGVQALYTLEVSLRAKDGGALLHRVSRKIGLRTFEWVTAPDEAPAVVAGQRQPLGATFHLRVNGRRIFCKGANWIPDDCFPHRVTPERYHRRVQQAAEANMNMLRVWGGGIYEDDAFYDACDELGVMVWQDFATACSCYPEDSSFKRRFEHEALDNVARLAGRASLALWCGGNENITATFEWGPEYRRMRDVSYGWGRHYWYELFPHIVAEVDSGTYYWPNSPWSTGPVWRAATPLPRAGEVPSESASEAERVRAQSSPPLPDPLRLATLATSPAGGRGVDGPSEASANLEHLGDQHIWDIWNGQGDWRNYWSHLPRFASEFGFHGPPTWPTLEQAIPAAERHWFSPTLVLHNKQDGGQERAINRARDHFYLPEHPESAEAFDAMWFIAALNQARAIQAGCEWFRALSPWCGGALYWQLNDCWPVASWSAIDSDTAGLGRPKLLWYATRRFFAPRLCALLPETVVPAGQEPGRPRVYLHNDHPERWAGELRLELATFDGQILETATAPFDVDPGGSLRYIVPGDWAAAHDRLVLATASGAGRSTWFFGRDKDLPYPAPRFDLEVTTEGNDSVVTITAQTLLRDVCLFPERLDPGARASDQLITLLPGESAKLRISGGRRFTAQELSAPGVLWSANRFGALRS